MRKILSYPIVMEACIEQHIITNYLKKLIESCLQKYCVVNQCQTIVVENNKVKYKCQNDDKIL